MRRREARLGEQVGEVDEDGDLLGDHRLAMADRRHLAHRVDREIGRLALLAGRACQQRAARRARRSSSSSISAPVERVWGEWNSVTSRSARMGFSLGLAAALGHPSGRRRPGRHPACSTGLNRWRYINPSWALPRRSTPTTTPSMISGSSLTLTLMGSKSGFSGSSQTVGPSWR